MLSHMKLHSWLPVLRGAYSILFGLFAFLLPGVTMEKLILFLSLFMMVDGIFALIHSFSSYSTSNSSRLFLVEGMTGFAAGGLALFSPRADLHSILALAAAWAIISGILQKIGAYGFSICPHSDRLLSISGGLNILFGLLLVFVPTSGTTAAVWITGLYAVLFGGICILFGLQLKGLEPGLPVKSDQI